MLGIVDKYAALERLVQQCADVKKGEQVLIVADSLAPQGFVDALSCVLASYRCEPSIMVFPTRKYHNEEPPKCVAEAMKAVDLVFEVTTRGIYHTKARREANEAGTRYVCLVGANEQMLVQGGLLADFLSIAPKVERIAKVLTEGKTLRVTAPNGTDFSASIDGRRCKASTGLARTPGSMGAPPDIEAMISPVEGTSNGKVVIDAYAVDIGVVTEPIVITVERGFAVDITGGKEAAALKKMLSEPGDPNMYNLGEVGIGLNPMGDVSVSILDAEGLAGTAHIALGSSPVGSGGAVVTKAHIDLVFYSPTVYVDGKAIEL